MTDKERHELHKLLTVQIAQTMQSLDQLFPDKPIKRVVLPFEVECMQAWLMLQRLRVRVKGVLKDVS